MRIKVEYQDDIRRFLAKGAKNNYDQLRSFVKDTFALTSFRLLYSDEEKELITIGSAEEYNEAVNVAVEDNRKSLKIFVSDDGKKARFTKQKREFIDVRSDTVTLPTEEMRVAMATAEVGDDVYGEDPTVNRLEEMCAEFLGKEAALFVSSGTQGNLLALLAHVDRRGGELIVGDRTHIYTAEQGGCSGLGGIHSRSIPNNSDGTLDLDKIEGAIQRDDYHNAITQLICLENTNNSAGGSVLSLEYMESVRNLADEYNLPIHLDGARVYNAAHALGVSVARVCRDVDSVNMCFSKGLAAPVGSVVAGSQEFVAKARRFRKAVGGGTRQCGVIAACCIVSLQSIYPRIPEDHANAQLLASGLSELPYINVETPETNLVFFTIDYTQLGMNNTTELIEYLLSNYGIKINGGYETVRIRMAMHNDITTSDVHTILEALRRVGEVEKSGVSPSGTATGKYMD